MVLNENIMEKNQPILIVHIMQMNQTEFMNIFLRNKMWILNKNSILF